MAKLIDASDVLTRLMAAHDLTQAEVAEAARVTPVTANRWVNGKQRAEWDDELASMGQNGWELVQVMLVQGQGTRDGYHFIFKRPTLK